VDVETFENSESFASMGELYHRRANRAAARVQHQRSLAVARAARAKGRSSGA
jgi:hypothetical protein